MTRAVIVGGGVIGTMHALFARRRGMDVVHLDADPEPRSATVRNFGMIWVSGRAPGAELAAALRARELWEGIGRAVAGVGFRAAGSLTLVADPAEVRVLEEVCARSDAADRELELLDPAEARARNPLLGGRFAAALWCGRDAVVEPGSVLPALRRHLAGNGYTWLGGRTVVDVGARSVTDHTGTRHDGDVVLLCPGARWDGPLAELVAAAPLRKVRLQMCQTAPLGRRMPTMLADGASLRYYPAFAVPARDRLGPAPELVARHHLQLLVSQRLGGELTVGDTHEYEQPFAFAVDEEPYAYLINRLEEMLGCRPPPVTRRWSGVYAQHLDPAALCHRAVVADATLLVTGPGGRGMTLAPALAEQTFEELT